MSDEPDVCIDLERWARAKYWTWEEVEYLFVGLDYWKVKKIEPDVELDLKDEKRKAVKDALQFHFRTEDVAYRVSPQEALEIARRAGLDVPEAPSAAVTASEENSTHSPGKLSSGDSNKYNKLLKMLFAIAVVQFGYRPSLNRQTAASEIVRLGEQLGIKFDRETVRARLGEAYDLLDEKESANVLEYFDE
ncbi:hypothetical protein [Roseovarius indicus]|uniref:Uncharacterized protein n=2 Tax=Roseovarius indicus TaxID=540747 RepID=A0A5P3AEY0_9RHOB|nr:hypothetical protein [Roseovarius indicus]QEW27917.1 hypothetical protein RIdsm_03740 [Roseovarius indicus]SFE86230.1 hypothetical protein SAMN04488031_1314 [Roseovarius indicus]